MRDAAPILSPAARTYRGAFTNPERWATWVPRRGDILVSTPPKSGTTWTQTILAMLLHGGPDLPMRLPVMSPWVDADLGDAAETRAALAAQSGRRVVKTHTPADGFPVWEGVTVIAVYRHPLDVFFSLRSHAANMAVREPDHPLLRPVPQALAAFLDGGADVADFDRDTLATYAVHFAKTVATGRVPGDRVFHYAAMAADRRAAVAALARAAGIAAGDALIGRVAEATAFGAMKARAPDYVPVGGTGFWLSDAGFFDSARSGKWEGRLGAEQIAAYRARLAALVPDPAARAWLETGRGPVPGACTGD